MQGLGVGGVDVGKVGSMVPSLGVELWAMAAVGVGCGDFGS